jgi:O-methyltransferase
MIQEPKTAEARYLNAEAEMYLDLLKQILTRVIAHEVLIPVTDAKWTWKSALRRQLSRLLAMRGYCLARPARFDFSARAEGTDWPAEAETMVGLKALENLQYCIVEALKNNVPGDLIETGVWRGGACIFMRAVLKIAADNERRVWVADSFEGLPKASVEADQESEQASSACEWQQLAVSVDEVKANFRKYGLLDSQVHFLKGWFRDTLPTAPIKRLAVIRLDGDMYESTWDALTALYPKLSPGGFLIVDDYYTWPVCKEAVDEYRRRFNVSEELRRVDQARVFWQKQ